MDHLKSIIPTVAFEQILKGGPYDAFSKALLMGDKLGQEWEQMQKRQQELKEFLLPSKDRTAAISYLRWWRRNVRRRFPGTCQWIDIEPDFETWLMKPSKQTPNLLWIYAIPGAGKSVMAAYIINYLHFRIEIEAQKEIVLYFFCKHDLVAQLTAAEVIKSLLLQVYSTYCPKPSLEIVSHQILELDLSRLTSPKDKSSLIYESTMGT